MFFRAIICGVVVLGLVNLSTSAAPMVIDGFESGAFNFSDTTDNGTSASQVQEPLGDVLGGRRTVLLQLNQPGSVNATVALTGGDDSVVFTFQQSGTPPGGTSTFVSLDYGSSLPQTNADLTDGGNDRFYFNFTEVPSNGFLFLQVDSDGPAIAQVTVPLPAPGLYLIPFADFSNLVGSINFTNIDHVTFLMSFDSTISSGVYSMSEFGVIPEPGSLGMILGLVALPLLHRKRYIYRHRAQ